MELFRRPPSPPHTHRLRVLDGDDARDLFRTLLAMLKCGISVLFADAASNVVHMGDIGAAELRTLEAYFRSFGVRLRVEPADGRAAAPTAGPALRMNSCVFRAGAAAFRVSFDHAPPGPHAG